MVCWMVISSTAPPIIHDAVAISVISDREGGARKACNGPAQVRESLGRRRRFEGEVSIEQRLLQGLLWSALVETQIVYRSTDEDASRCALWPCIYPVP
jgi:hypothetical protein